MCSVSARQKSLTGSVANLPKPAEFTPITFKKEVVIDNPNKKGAQALKLAGSISFMPVKASNSTASM
jgi:hypothetical protein